MSYLHIHKTNYYDELWQEGRYINFNINSFWDFSMHINPKVFNNYLDLINEYQLMLRELSLEYVRLERFNSFPSRKKSFWLIRNDNEQLNYWMNNLDGEKRLFEVEIDLQNGKIFKSRDFLLPKKENDFKTMLEEAKKYWSYNLIDNFSDDEYIYEGKLYIKREIPVGEGMR